MMPFSQRQGIRPIKSVIQVDSMDDDLRNRLWNALEVFYWALVKHGSLGQRLLSDEINKGMYILLRQLWDYYFKRPIDTIELHWDSTHEEMKEDFFGCAWDGVYDLIEFIANHYPDERVNHEFMEFCNQVLEQELSAYRFVGGEITPITAEEEIAEIEEALQVPMKPVKEHLKRSLDLFADRENPDYRNSIKEAISAVESICKLIAKDDKADLDKALKEIDRQGQVGLHPALKAAFSKLYGYTSDANGIRHALMDEPNVVSEDAKFMLVACSAFINYLVAKSSKAGIEM